MNNTHNKVNRDVVKGAAEMVEKCRRKGGGLAGSPRRDALIRAAVLAVEHEIRKDPEGFARYVVSRMAWDMLSGFGQYNSLTIEA